MWTNLKGEATDKVVYRHLAEPPSILDYDHYVSGVRGAETSGGGEPVTGGGRIFVKNGNVYDVTKLIDQSEKDEKRIATLTEQLKSSRTKIGEFAERVRWFLIVTRF